MEWEMSEEKTKELLTEIMVDMLRNHRSLFRDIVREALEDAGLIQAIQEGRRDEFVAEEDIMELLGGGGERGQWRGRCGGQRGSANVQK